MTNKFHKKAKQEKLSFFDHAMEIIGWLQIVASPLFGGLIIGGILYLWIGDTAGLVIGISVTLTALIVGIVLANSAWKKGTINLMSRVNASPELDHLEDCSETNS
jgi:hypothetical protein